MRLRDTVVFAAVACVVAAGLSGCSGDGGLPSLPKSLNPFASTEQPIPGKRVAVLTDDDTLAGNLETASVPVQVPPIGAVTEWSQPGGVASNAPGHLSYGGGLKTAWTGDAGTGSSSDARLTAVPVVHQGRLYTLDAAAVVTAFNASGGGKAWSQSLVPENEDGEEGYGGGLAAEGDRVFAATGFGTVVALSAQGGAKLWEVKLGAPIRSSPTVADGRVFALTIEGKLACLSAADGSELWSYRGPPQQASLLNNTSPAVSGEVVVVPFPSGDVIAVNAASGEPVWADTLGSSRAGSGLASLTNPARPVIEDGIVYAVGNSGRIIATAAANGERLWSHSIASVQTPWVAGDAIYLVDVNGRLMALARASGEVRWAVKLPGGTHIWNGPVLAGGKLWLVSAEGLVVGADPATGNVVGQRSLDAKVLVSPIVADGRLYLYDDDARVIALN
jgi:outer membrane protein assembly factor BamB